MFRTAEVELKAIEKVGVVLSLDCDEDSFDL